MNTQNHINSTSSIHRSQPASAQNGWRSTWRAAALSLTLLSGSVWGAGGDAVDFKSGALEDSFADNVLFGDSPYSLAPVGLNKMPGIKLDDTLAREGTLVYKKKSYDLSKLTSLEVSCLFKRRPIGAASHALVLGLTSASKGHLSGVTGAAFVGLRLQVVDGSLRMQFQSKAADTAALNFSTPGLELKTVEGNWYRLKVTFSRVDAANVRVTGVLSNMTETGADGSVIGYFGPNNFSLPGFHVGEIADAHEVWVALRANGAGGAEALDGFQIVANSPTGGEAAASKP
jgi:hypothetical protein